MSMPDYPRLHLGDEPNLTVVTVTSHCDWAWTHSRAWHEARYAEMIRRYLLIMRDHPHYVCEMETVNEQLMPFLTRAREAWPELIEEFWQRVDQGRIVMTVGYSNPRISEVYPETLVRNLILGKEIYRTHAPNSEQLLYNAVDVMAGSGQVPQVLIQAGYHYFVFQRAGGEQLVFWRQGLDGSRILTSRSMSVGDSLEKPPSACGYGATVKGIQPLPIWRVGLGMDDAMPSPAIAVQAAEWDPDTMVLSTALHYLQTCETCGVPISEVADPLDSLSYYANAGLHGNHNLYTQNNCNEDLLLTVEKAEAMADMLGQPCWIESIDGLWRDLLSCTGHAMLWIWEADYEERLAKTADTRARGKRALEEALSAIACGIAFDREIGTPLVIFNVHDRQVAGPVEFRVDALPVGLVLRDRHGTEVPLQSMGVDADGERRLAFMAQGVPACGFQTLYLNRSATGASPATPETDQEKRPIENRHYRIDMHPDGRLEIFDKALGRVLGDAGQDGLGDLVVYDLPPSTDWTHNGPTGNRRDMEVDWATFDVTRGPVFSSLRVSGAIGPHRVTREVRLWADDRRIEFVVEIEGGEDNGVLCIRFPLGLAGRVVAGVPFGVESRDDTDSELARGEAFSAGYPEGYYGTRWTDVSTPEWGYTFVCPPGVHTGYAFRKDEKALEFTLLRFRPMPEDVFRRSHPTLQGRGRHTWRCALIPHEGDWRQAKSTRWALEQHVPLLVHSPWFGMARAGVTADRELSRQTEPVEMCGTVRLEKNAAEGPQETSLAEISPPNVVLSSMRRLRNPAGNTSHEYELRLYESVGEATDVIVRLGIPVARVQQTNLLGEPLDETGPIHVSGSEIRCRIQPWKIVTLRVTRAE